MDEPCSALDPIATSRIEDLMLELKDDYSIVIVTHNMQQAARVSDMTAVLMPDVREGDVPVGRIVEYADTEQDLHQPRKQAHRGLRDRKGGLTWPRCGSSSTSSCESSSRRSLSTADLTSTMLDQAIEAVTNGDAELARMVIDGDDRIDGRYLDVHQGILSLLARQAPVASDLRLVAALLHTIVHIERIGDLCVNIAKLVFLIPEQPAGAATRSSPASRPPRRRPATRSSRPRSPSATATSSWPRTS